LFYRFKSIRKMKKLVFMFVAVAAISFASCGNKAQQAPVDTDSIAEVVDSIVDSLATDTVAAADSVK
jgi:predicted small secreted protein